MPDDAPIRFIYRYVPWLEVFQWSISALAMIAFTLYVGVQGAWTFAPLPALGALYFGIRLGLVKRLILLVDGNGLTIVRRPFLWWFGSFEIIAASQVRHVRYSLEVADVADSGGRRRSENHYRLDVITVDSRIVKLINSAVEPLPRRLPSQIAAAMGASYEEYLEPPD